MNQLRRPVRVGASVGFRFHFNPDPGVVHSAKQHPPESVRDGGPRLVEQEEDSQGADGEGARDHESSEEAGAEYKQGDGDQRALDDHEAPDPDQHCCDSESDEGGDWHADCDEESGDDERREGIGAGIRLAAVDERRIRGQGTKSSHCAVNKSISAQCSIKLSPKAISYAHYRLLTLVREPRPQSCLPPTENR